MLGHRLFDTLLAQVRTTCAQAEEIIADKGARNEYDEGILGALDELEQRILEMRRRFRADVPDR